MFQETQNHVSLKICAFILFLATDALVGKRKGFQSGGGDIVAAFLAYAVGSLSDLLYGFVDLLQFAAFDLGQVK